MSLENLNLVELNAQEMKEVEGGFWAELIVGVLVGIIMYLIGTSPSYN